LPIRSVKTIDTMISSRHMPARTSARSRTASATGSDRSESIRLALSCACANDLDSASVVASQPRGAPPAMIWSSISRSR
jgi:hypothetical protein